MKTSRSSNVIFVFFSVCTILLFNACQQEEKSKLESVNPFIGTAMHGHTYPGASAPFGMVQLSPDNGRGGWDWCSGYNYIENRIIGFSHKHLSGTGIGDLCDILINPTCKDIVESKDGKSFAANYISVFSHDEEEASPGYYAVKLKDSLDPECTIQTEFTVSKRTGFHHYIYPDNFEPRLILDLGYALNWDAPVETSIQLIDKNTVQGFRKSRGWANNQQVYFYMVFSENVESMELFDNGKMIESQQHTSVFTAAAFHFKHNNLMVKIGLSPTDIEGAKRNLEAENPGWNFDAVKKEVQKSWEHELDKFNIVSDDVETLETFYTAVYHSFLAPNLFSDVDGRYRGIDRKIHTMEKGENYTVFSLWDTFRAAHPLFTLTQKERVLDFIRAMILHYKESGLLPVWSLEGCETGTMIGYHAIPVIAEAYVKGLRGFDAELALEAMVASSMTNIEGLDHYREYQYIPADLENESVSKTLEYAYDDYCIAQMAKAMGKDDLHKEYMQRSMYYKNLFDDQTGFMRGKLSDGTWKEEFNPRFSRHRNDEYVEGNAWQYSWFVPHDVEGLINLHGGKDDFYIKLDSLFNIESEILGQEASPDISGLIGQYAHGNEPSHHVAYLFNEAGHPERTQELVHQIRNEMYSNQPDGLCGNEDCGQMSAWYVLSAMGFYPVDPVSGTYQIGTPLFEELRVQLSPDDELLITAEGLSQEQFYVEEVFLNGEKLDRWWVSHEELSGNAHLHFKMKPN